MVRSHTCGSYHTIRQSAWFTLFARIDRIAAVGGALFKKSKKCGQKEVLSEILCNKYLPLKEVELFDLFSSDNFSKIRKYASQRLKETMNRYYVKVIDVFCKDGYFHVKPEYGKYDMIYRAARGVYWDEDTQTLYYKGEVSKEVALKFISKAMKEEYYTILDYDSLENRV